MIEHLSVEDIKGVLRAGGGLTIDLVHLDTEEIASVARATKDSGAKLVLIGLGHLGVEDIKRIARAGAGNVSFVAKDIR